MAEATIIALNRGQIQRWAARSDDDLMLLAGSGQVGAFDEIVRRHQRGALQVAGKYLGHPTLAQDVVQNTFVEIYRALARFRPSGRFRGYLLRVLLNQCRMAARSRGSARRAMTRFAEHRPPEGHQDERLLARERQRLVEDCITRLNDKLRTVIVLHYAAELSHEEIATQLRLPVGTVKSRLFAGLKRMRAMLVENGRE